jgi:hypothetical protein
MADRLISIKTSLVTLKIVQSVEAAFALDVFPLQVNYTLAQYF